MSHIIKYYKLLIPVISLNLLLCCNNSKTNSPGPEKTIGNENDTVPAAYHKPPSSSNDTLIIRGMAAVFFNPDSLQLQKISQARPKMRFESDTHDCFFQMRNARMVLKQYWPQVKIIETSAARFLLFVHNDRSGSLTDLNTINDMCGILLFNGMKKPELTDMMNIDSGLEYYFKK